MSGDIAVVGLAVMGQNLILNMDDHGFTVVAYNRTYSKVESFLANEAKGTKILGAKSVEDMVAQLKAPRKIMLMVKAGSPVDDFIDQVAPHLSPGDIIIDGGNSHFPDTIRRTAAAEAKGLLYVGCGVSGGEEGARHGPSLMPGGSPAAWPAVKPIFQAIAAKVDGEPCCEWLGEDGSGHYVKMVHNGIEYGDIQVICEAYHIMKTLLGLDNEAMADIFEEWNKGVLDSYLIEITTTILRFKDTDGSFLVEKIKDVAGQKGTGKWTAVSALDLGVPVTLIGEAVFSRTLSALKDERVAASSVLTGPSPAFTGDKKAFVEGLRDALYASKIVSYAQGFAMLRAAAAEHKWHLNFPAVALMWRGGCIIRSKFLGDIRAAFNKAPELNNLLLDSFFSEAVTKAQAGWREVVAEAALNGLPTPAFSAALAYYDGYRSARLPANLLQAQRDYFGAHTYTVLGDEGAEPVHTNWTGTGGNVSSSTYNA